jgi:transcriptional regulator with XRE-family HTH domain
MADEWFVLLTRARAQLNLSQAELAARSHVSLASIKSYETGKRHPSRPYLTAILDALKTGREERNAILNAAGFAIDGMALGPAMYGEFMFTPDEAAAEVEKAAWPAFVLGEMMQVVAANAICQRLWGVDLRTEYLEPTERNFLTVASDPKFADRVANWDECVGVIAAVFRGHHRGAEDLESPSPYFNALLERFLEGDPKYVARFLTVWQKTVPRTPKIRWRYPVVWDEPGIGVMRFHAYVSTANEPDGLAFNDWVPVGAESWLALERLRSGS